MTGTTPRGELPRTVHGQPSYTLARSLLTQDLAGTLAGMQQQYGLMDVEMADLLAGAMQDYLRYAVRSAQERNPERRGVIGTPRQDEQAGG